MHQVDVSKLDFEISRKVDKKLLKMLEMGGSDLHIKATAPVRARVDGEIRQLGDWVISKEEALTFSKELLRTRFSELVEKKEVDLTYTIDQVNRFRVNVFFQMEGVSAVFRVIPDNKLTLQELKMPQSLNQLVDMKRGIVLVTGMTGSGKSTTLAAIIDQINRTHPRHIITIEDPIEFVHKDNRSVINQRSVGQDTHSFSSALRAALREDPDIILVGEMRDVETIEMALHAAETGHLVFSTLHTLDAKETINRIIGVFPPYEQGRIRFALSSVLQSVVSQRLVKTKDNKRRAAVEVLFKTPRISALIKEDRDSEIMEAMEEGRSIYQTQTFDQSLFSLWQEGVISEEEALANATSPSDLKLKMSNNDNASKTSPGASGVIGLKNV